MGMEWIGAIISGFFAVVVAVIGYFTSWETKRNQKARQEMERQAEKLEKRAEIRAEESRLSIDLNSATCALAMVSAKKLTGQHTNGDVAEAMQKAAEAQEEYTDFLRRTAARQVTK